MRVSEGVKEIYTYHIYELGELELELDRDRVRDIDDRADQLKCQTMVSS